MTPSIFGRQGLRVHSPALFDFSALVSLRREHQTLQAEKGIRRRVAGIDQNVSEPGKPSSRAKLIKAMNEALKETQDQGLTTGTGRSLRTKALGTKDNKVSLSGNSANAATVANTEARSVCLITLYSWVLFLKSDRLLRSVAKSLLQRR